MRRRTNKFRKELSKSRSGKLTGENNPNSKLTNKQREEIRELYQTTDIKYRELAEQFKVNISTITNVLKSLK